MIFYNHSLISELQKLPPHDREKIVQELHWAIAENLSKTTIRLQEFRDGEELRISSYEYSELYNALSGNNR